MPGREGIVAAAGWPFCQSISIPTKLRILHVRVTHILLCSETCTLTQADWKRLDSFHLRCQRRILHISWHDFVFNDEVLRHTGLFDVSYIVRKRRLRSDVPANLILWICTKTRDGERPSQKWRRTCGRPSTTWVHQICRDMGVSATEALLLAEDRPFWRTIATAGGFGWSIRVMMMMMMMMTSYVLADKYA